MTKDSILVSVTHNAFFLPGVKKAIDKYGKMGDTILMEEAAFNTEKEARQFLVNHNFPQGELDFLLEHNKFGTFFPTLKEHAEANGIKVVSADGGIGREIAQQYFLGLCRATLEKKRGNEKQASEIYRKAKKEYRHNDFLKSRDRSKMMFQRTETYDPKMVIVGDVHGAYLKKRRVFSKTIFIGQHLNIYQRPVYAIGGLIARMKEKHRKQRVRK